ncbi:hypothetical protein [Rhodoferax ferrireducens]|uniref:hypothetical protein n=1 Tax=Rhodoferax ferrireducens TaxID=192843 RepID=UPI00140FD104|nr:hypothetical protein [Rhodoferax ferrireducens]
MGRFLCSCCFVRREWTSLITYPNIARWIGSSALHGAKYDLFDMPPLKSIVANGFGRRIRAVRKIHSIAGNAI